MPAPEEKHHTVINGVIQHLSVSQINSFNPAEDGGCNLRWHFNKVQGKKEPERDFNKTGTAGHAQLKHFLQTGDDVLGHIVRAGLHLLPPRGDALRLEWGLNDKPQPVDAKGQAVNYFPPHESLVKVAGIPLIGFIDVIDPRAEHLVSDLSGIRFIREPGTVEVLDHKTTSDFKWAKAADKLPETSQMNGYGVFAAVKFPWATHIRQSHIVYLTKGEAPARKASIVVPVSEIKNRWRNVVEPLVEKMKWVAKQTEDKVEGNTDACGAYGGCPHKLYCSVYKNQSRGKRLKMGLLRNKPAAAAPAVNGAVAAAPTNTPWIPPPPGIAAPALVAAPAAVQAPIIHARPTIQNVIAAGTAVAGQTYITGDGKAVTFASEAGPGWRVFSPVGGGAPQMLEANTALTEFTPPAPQPAASQVVRDAGAPAAPPPLAAQVPAPPAIGGQAAPAAPTETKRGRGRPKKNAEAPQGASVAVQPNGDVEVYINAIPPGQFTNLSEYVAEVVNDIQEQFAVADIRCAPIDSAIGYLKWRGALAGAVKADPPAAGTYVAFTKGNEFTEIVAETLAQLFPQTTVRGV